MTDRNESELPAFKTDVYRYSQERVYLGTDFFATISAQNIGEESSGVGVIVGGPAVEKGLFEPTMVRLQAGDDHTVDWTEHPVEEMVEISPGTFAITLRHFAIPAGLPDEDLLSAKGPGAVRRIMNNRFKSTVTVQVWLHALNEGEADIYLAVAPLANKEEGILGVEIPTRVVPVPRMPRFGRLDAHPAELDMLQLKHVLFAFVALTGDQDHVLDVTTDAALQWCRFLSENSERVFQTEFLDAEEKATRRKWSIQDLATDSRWTALRKKFNRFERLSIQMSDSRTDDGDYIHGDDTGLEISTYRQRETEDTRDVLCYATFSIETMDPVKRVPAVLTDPVPHAVLSDVVDGIFTQPVAIQAFCGHWVYPPNHHELPTAYEYVCGVKPEARAREWCEKQLRGVTPMMWLGRGLVDSLGAAASTLVEIDGVESTPYGFRIKLNEPDQLEELEAALEPLLPVP